MLKIVGLMKRCSVAEVLTNCRKSEYQQSHSSPATLSTQKSWYLNRELPTNSFLPTSTPEALLQHNQFPILQQGRLHIYRLHKNIKHDLIVDIAFARREVCCLDLSIVNRVSIRPYKPSSTLQFPFITVLYHGPTTFQSSLRPRPGRYSGCK